MKKKTKAQEKMFSYLVSLASNNDFIERVVEIREMFSLPKKGFEKDIENTFEYIQSLPIANESNGDEVSFEKAVGDLASRFDVGTAWLNNIQDYVLYDDFFFTKVTPLVEMIDVIGLIRDIEDQEERKINIRQALDNITDSYPIAIFLSPYATGKDIIDFVKKELQGQIKPAQSRYKEKEVKIGKIRKRNTSIQERDMFICKHKNLPRKELVRRVAEKYCSTMDYTYINKIIAKKCPRENK